MVNTTSIMKRKKAFIGILLCFLIFYSVCEGTTAYKSQEPSPDNSLDVLTFAGFKNPSVRRTSEDKLTDVDITPSFSPHKSAVRKLRAPKLSSVNNQGDADGLKNVKQSASIIQEDFKPLILRTKDRRKTNKKVSMTKFIMRRAATKSNDLEQPASSGISQGDLDVSSLIRQAIKRGWDAALKQASKVAAQHPQETTTEDMNKLREIAMLWKRKTKDPSNRVKTRWDTETILDEPSSKAKEHSIGNDPAETYQPSEEVVNTDSLALQSTQPTSVTGVPYVTRPRPSPKLTNLLLEEMDDSPTSAEETNSVESAKSDSTESKLDLNLHTSDSITVEPAKSDSAGNVPNLNLDSAEPTTVKSAKTDSAGSELNLNTGESSTSAESQTILEDSAEETTKEKSTRNNREQRLPHEQPRVSRQERSPQHGTSTIPEVNMNVHPTMRESSGLRWNVALERRDTSDSRNDKRSKSKKKRKSQSSTEDPDDSNSPIIIFGCLIGGVFMLLVMIQCVMSLCKCYKRRAARRLGDPELGIVTSSPAGHVGKEDGKEVIFERTATGQKKKTSKYTPESSPGCSNVKPQDVLSTNNTTDIPLAPVSCSATGTPSTVVRINVEASDSTLPESSYPTSVRSEPSISTLNKTPQPTPVKSRSVESLSTPAKSSVSESDILTCSREPNLPSSTAPTESGEKKMESTPLVAQSKLVTETSANEDSVSIPMDSFSFSKDSEQQANPVALETGATNSSTESCKTPVAPCSDVIITVDDDDESKSPLLTSENESSSAEVIYVQKESTSDTKVNTGEQVGPCNDDMKTNDQGTRCDEGKPPLPPSPTRPPSASTELRQGKSNIGGRKALGNRRFIKHLTSGQYSSGFHGDLNKALNKIMTGNKLLADKSTEKRKVIKQQTKKTNTSLKENLLLAKSIITNKEMDSVRDKKSALRRRIIHKALSHPATLRPHTPLSEEIAFAKSVILPDPIDQKTERNTKERHKVVKELVDELNNPLFEDMIKIFAATFNPDEKTRDLNNRNEYKRNVIMIDAQMLKVKNQKSSFLLDIQFGRNVICGPSTLDHEQNPRMGCTCYYCKKHWKKTGGPPCFKIPRDFDIAKDVYLINGKIYIRKSLHAARGSTSSYRPGIDTAKVLLGQYVKLPIGSDV
ncbi:uncharacterized protein LOC144654292 isoform X2 [Oculina patagonica]